MVACRNRYPNTPALKPIRTTSGESLFTQPSASADLAVPQARSFVQNIFVLTDVEDILSLFRNMRLYSVLAVIGLAAFAIANPVGYVAHMVSMQPVTLTKLTFVGAMISNSSIGSLFLKAAARGMDIPRIGSSNADDSKVGELPKTHPKFD